MITFDKNESLYHQLKYSLQAMRERKSTGKPLKSSELNITLGRDQLQDILEIAVNGLEFYLKTKPSAWSNPPVNDKEN